MTEFWSFVILALGWASAYYLGQQHQVGWWISIVTQIIWGVYDWYTGQYVFIAGSVVSTLLAVRGLRRLARTRQELNERR